MSSPLISPNDHWGNWTALFAAAASFGIWLDSEIGSSLSGALVSILVGFAASNLGIVSCGAPACHIVLEYLFPLAVPLLLYRADLPVVIQSTGTLLLVLLVGSVAVTVGTVIAFLLMPMQGLGQDGWKTAAAFVGRHIGGAVSYVSIAEALAVSPSVLAAGLAADNVICAAHFTTLFAVAAKIPPEVATSITVYFAICKTASILTKYFSTQGGSLPAITAIVVILTSFPELFANLAPSGEAMAFKLMQVFFVMVGASGSIWNAIDTTPSIFLFALVQVSAHLAFVLGLGKLLGLDLKLLLLASNANVGSSATACGMATAKGWTTLIVPAILAGIFGNAIATLLGIGFGVVVLRRMYDSEIPVVFVN